jgi:hypothetical protein
VATTEKPDLILNTHIGLQIFRFVVYVTRGRHANKLFHTGNENMMMIMIVIITITIIIIIIIIIII